MLKCLFTGLLCFISSYIIAQSEKGTLKKHVSANFHSQPLRKCFSELEKIAKVHFYFSEGDVASANKTVTADFSDKSLREILSVLLSGTDLIYQENSIGILIMKSPSETKVSVKNSSDNLIHGNVVDKDSKQPVIGATVKLNSKSFGTLTNENGDFRIRADVNDEITVSSVGYSTEKVIVGIEKNITVNLRQNKNALEDVQVVTTALGLKRQERSLGYATQVVTGEQLTNAMSDNWADALSGKVAGLNLVRSNSGPDGSIKIILRGENNLTDGASNEALIVVDGVVVNQGSGRRTGTNQGESVYATGSDNLPSDYGSSLNDINPEDIASVTVLKGPAAAALYGQRGANGAVMITTKSGTAGKMSVNFRSNATFESINRWPDMQYEYGQGTGGATYYSYGKSADGASTSATSSTYGPKFDGQYFYQYNPGLQGQDTVRTLWKPYTNQIKDFFTTGQTYTNTVSLEGGTKTSSSRLSATDVKNTWILPNTGYHRNTVSLSYKNNLTDKLVITTNIDYTNKRSGNLPAAGYGNQSLMYWFIFWQPNADLNWLKNYWVKGKEGQEIEYPFSSYPSNPYAVTNEYLNKLERNSVTGNIQATYNFTQELSLQVRSSLDMADEHRSQKRPFDASGKYPYGSYREQNIFSYEQTNDFLLRYAKKINQKFDLSASFGGSALVNRYRRDETRADSLYYPGIYTFANKRGVLQSYPWKSSYDINSFYGQVTGGYKNYLYLDLTGREDWNSVLATPNRTDNAGFFYSSANLSFVLSDAVKLPALFNYAKLRFSASQVGSGLTTPYVTSFNYMTAGALFSGGMTNPNILPDVNLQPLKTTTYETGANFAVLKDKINVDVALYSSKTKNQIISRTIDAASGYTQAKTNLAEVDNKGIEVTLNTKPISSKNFSWTSNINFSANKNMISGITDSTIVLAFGPTGGTQIIAKNGGSTGDMYGIGFQRSPDGQILYDPSTGNALLTSNVKYLGKTTPSGKISWQNTFTYKKLSLNLLFDAQYGAVAYSLTAARLADLGKTKNTLPGRYSGIIGNGEVENADGTYSKNDVIATDVTSFYSSMYGSNNGEGGVYSTNFIKFREASLNYTFSPELLKRIKIKKLTIGVYGRDLFIWTKWPDFDPEFGTLSGTDIVKGFEVGQFPSTRSFGANLIVGF